LEDPPPKKKREMRKTKEKEEKKEDDPKRTPLSNELALFCTHKPHAGYIYI